MWVRSIACCSYLDFKLKSVQGLQRSRVNESAVGRATELDQYFWSTGNCFRHWLTTSTELQQHWVTRRVAIVHCDVILYFIALRPYLKDVVMEKCLCFFFVFKDLLLVSRHSCFAMNFIKVTVNYKHIFIITKGIKILVNTQPFLLKVTTCFGWTVQPLSGKTLKPVEETFIRSCKPAGRDLVLAVIHILVYMWVVWRK